jgi:hypothetical protein
LQRNACAAEKHPGCLDFLLLFDQAKSNGP